MATALVTGPTSGLGRQFAIQLAARGNDLVLVSRDETRLTELALQLESDYAVECEVMPTDLGDRIALAKVEARLRNNRRPVDWLVNNAGFAFADSFLDTTVEQQQALLDVLVTAPMRLTHAALPGMIERGFGRMIVVSSFASWITSGTYSAAKAWATVFTEGLQAQLNGTGVHATALCPGLVRTELHERAEIEVKAPDQMWLQADEVVATALKDCDKGNVLSIPGRQYQAMAPMLRMSPRALVRRLSALR